MGERTCPPRRAFSAAGRLLTSPRCPGASGSGRRAPNNEPRLLASSSSSSSLSLPPLSTPTLTSSSSFIVISIHIAIAVVVVVVDDDVDVDVDVVVVAEARLADEGEGFWVERARNAECEGEGMRGGSAGGGQGKDG